MSIRSQRPLRYRLEQAAFVAARQLLALAPPAAALGLGARLGPLAGAALRDRARIADLNLAIAFPELPEAERRRLRRASFANLGRGAAEWIRVASGRGDELLADVEVQGLEHVEQARRLSPRGGVIALSAHLGNWELACAVVARRGLPVSMVYRALRNPHLDRQVARWRTATGIRVRPLGTAAPAALRDLAEGRIVVMTLDQNARRREGVFVPFFGLDACTRAGPAQVALRTGVPVVPVFDARMGGSGHVVRFHPALELEAGGRGREARETAVRRNTARMTGAIEDAVRKAPEDWIWSHRRWKTRPRGEPRRYPSRRGAGPSRSR